MLLIADNWIDRVKPVRINRTFVLKAVQRIHTAVHSKPSSRDRPLSGADHAFLPLNNQPHKSHRRWISINLPSQRSRRHTFPATHPARRPGMTPCQTPLRPGRWTLSPWSAVCNEWRAWWTASEGVMRTATLSIATGDPIVWKGCHPKNSPPEFVSVHPETGKLVMLPPSDGRRPEPIQPDSHFPF